MFGADLTVAEYIRKSLIASYIGNIVGALFVGMPALYIYLGDYQFADTQLKDLEERKEEKPGSSNTVQEVYRVSSKQS
ncbi:hypothetical protein PHLCEN_2v2024 [Hermanssonia centrifuga]|nr:hypothetical protein PHLCEN_2v2024 [Hermanssonia centrifuga]